MDIGGWSPNGDCSHHSSNDTYYLPYTLIDTYGCPWLMQDPRVCCLCPPPDASADGGPKCPAGSTSPVPPTTKETDCQPFGSGSVFCDSACFPNNPYLYICVSGEPGAGCVFTDVGYCCEREVCTRFTALDATCGSLGAYYFCPFPEDGGAAAIPPGTCTVMNVASGQNQGFCCK